MERMTDEGCTRILAAPLYPQYCAATTATANDALFCVAGARCAGSRRSEPCRLITRIRSTSKRCEQTCRAPARITRFRARTPAAQLPWNAGADARARRSLSLPLPEDGAAAWRALGRDAELSFQSRFGRASRSSRRPIATLRYPSRGVPRVAVAAPDFPPTAGDDPGARHPRVSKVPGIRAERNSRCSIVSTISPKHRHDRGG